LGQILIDFEDSLKAIIKDTNPTMKDEEIILSVVGIVDDSLGIKYHPNIPEIAMAFTIISTSFLSENFDALPSRSLDSLREVQSKIRKYNCVGQFKINGEPRGEITPTTEIKISENQRIKGDTTIYGKIVRVGGVSPRIRLELIEGYGLSINVSEEVAREIARNLYDVISLNGIATWNRKDFHVIDFDVESIGKYRATSNINSFNELREVLGEYWDKIDNIEEILHQS